MVFDSRYKEMEKNKFKDINKENYIEVFKYLIQGLEEQIRIRFKNQNTHNEYIKLLTEAEENMKHFSLKPFDEYKDEIIKLLNSIAKIRKKTYEISTTQKIEIFIKYIENNAIPTQDSNIRFCDIDNNNLDNSIVGKWFLAQIYSNLEQFKKELEKYKYTYENAYKKVIEKTNKLPQTKNITNTSKIKIRIFLESIEKGKIDLPIKDNKLIFSKLDPIINSNTIVKDWFKNITSKNREEFLKVCTEKKEEYPYAYSQVLKFLPEKDRITLNTELRLQLLMKYANEHKLPPQNSKISFYEIDNQYNDKKTVMSWVRMQVINNKEELEVYIEKYKNEYIIGYYRIKEKMNEIITSRENNQNLLTKLTPEEKIEVFIKYINENEIPTNNSKITFEDLVPDSNAKTRIYDWTIQNIFNDRNKVLKIMDKYKELYPKGCRRLYFRLKELEEERSKRPEKISYEEKVKLIMRYIEKNKMIALSSYLKFCDLDKSVRDNVSVGNWLRDQLSKNLYKFISEFTKYKDIYPNAYRKITSRINNSGPQITKNRKKLLAVLTEIKEELEIVEKKYTLHK